MMLTETNGLRVQVTSPSLGAANVRVQGLRGRYTQILSDGLPLYGQAGSIGILQIPPMDLAQVEVIKGVASALYGGSALGGVVNLISRQPRANTREREVLINRTSRGGTDTAVARGARQRTLGRHFPRRRALAGARRCRSRRVDRSPQLSSCRRSATCYMGQRCRPIALLHARRHGRGS
jgi:outer membrane receptor protein involved in Fe transport